MKISSLAAPLLVLTTGCYNTVPLAGVTPVAGKELVVQLTDAGSRELSVANGEERLWNKEIVGIPRQYIATTGQKVLSSSKTIGVAALSAVAAIAVKIGFSGITGTKGKTTGPPVSQ